MGRGRRDLKRMVLVEVDIPGEDDIVHQAKWIKEQLGQRSIVRILRFKDMEDYECSFDEYWRFG